ncbi:hypothetical protein [Paraburkholderia sp. 35.1]|uniref:hypothetical protein n=1 Tax=unclassified Paraburkholderia TaxID=2615204 RepID=UPI003D1DB808
MIRSRSTPPASPDCAQILVLPNDFAIRIVSSRNSPVDGPRYRLTVRAIRGTLQVVAAWKALGQYAADVEQVQIGIDNRHGFEEITFTFGDISSGALVRLVRRQIALPWTLDAYFYSDNDATA